jgi:hypothetical protein
MTIAGMQPYLFPYIGYFQLIHASDKFILADDLQYVNAGWINRNRILINGMASMVTLPLARAEHTSLIMERQFAATKAVDRTKLKRQISLAYGRAMNFKNVFPLLCSIIDFDETNLALYNRNQIIELCNYMSIKTPILNSSDLLFDKSLKRQERVIAKSHFLNADHWINAIGGTVLYDKAAFAEHGIRLSFLKTKRIVYKQFKDEFVENLSIIDVLMFNPIDHVHSLLEEYDLI